MRLAICCLAASAVSIDALWFSSGSNNAGISASNAASSAARRRTPIANILEDFLGGPLARGFGPPVVMGTEEMMSQKEYGTSAVPIQKDLRWNCDVKTADNICNYNRHYAEYGGYFERATTFLQEESEASGEITFYDSNTGRPLFYGPRGRSWDEFVKESKVHGWPSFRDSEVNWDFVRVLPNGECISVDGTQ